MKKLMVSIMALALLSGVAKADWDVDDKYKMHYPQLPDPGGWDVRADYYSPDSYYELGDDWQCTETGPVEDIHIWGSWWHDQPGTIEHFKISIYSNVLGPPSHPGTLLWQRDIYTFDDRLYGDGEQGWFVPPDSYTHPDHYMFYQYNITNIVEPFIQQQGEIYWLVISADIWGEVYWGWKTSSEHFMDKAVARWAGSPAWSPLSDPGGAPIDLAFVITSEEEPAIPTLTEWGMITLVLLLLAAGTVVIVRKRRMVRAR